MKKSTKFYSSLIAALMLTSGSLVPIAKAETFEQIQRQSLSQIQQSSETQSITGQAATTQAAVSQVSFKHQINANQNHEYAFKTNGGNFAVTALHPEADGLDFLVYNTVTEETMDPASSGTFTLTAG